MAKSYRCLRPVDNICPALIGALGNNCPEGGGKLCSAPARVSPPSSSGHRCSRGVVLRETREDAPWVAEVSAGPSDREVVGAGPGKAGGGEGGPRPTVGMCWVS